MSEKTITFHVGEGGQVNRVDVASSEPADRITHQIFINSVRELCQALHVLLGAIALDDPVRVRLAADAVHTRLVDLRPYLAHVAQQKAAG